MHGNAATFRTDTSAVQHRTVPGPALVRLDYFQSVRYFWNHPCRYVFLYGPGPSGSRNDSRDRLPLPSADFVFFLYFSRWNSGRKRSFWRMPGHRRHHHQFSGQTGGPHYPKKSYSGTCSGSFGRFVFSRKHCHDQIPLKGGPFPVGFFCETAGRHHRALSAGPPAFRQKKSCGRALSVKKLENSRAGIHHRQLYGHDGMAGGHQIHTGLRSGGFEPAIRHLHLHSGRHISERTHNASPADRHPSGGIRRNNCGHHG